ncbi:hypothetical protein ACFLXX_00635 [Chloroflexota bacterium]
MEPQEEEYRHNVWEIYRKEWETASPEKKTELNKRMLRWQELMKNGLTASQAYSRAMQEESDKSPVYTLIKEESDYRVVKHPSDKRPAIPSAPRTLKATLVFVGLALVAAIIYGFVITGDRNALNTELESVQSILITTQAQLSNTQTELSSTKQSLISTQTELDSTKKVLASTQTELEASQVELSTTKQTLTSTKQTLASTQSELGSTRSTLVSTQTQLSSTKDTLTLAQQQLVIAQETLEGLGITISTSKECSDVALIDNPTATNPTWSQLMTFLHQDQTDSHTYITNTYDCSQFSRDIHNNAEAAGIRAAEVQIKFRNEEVGHALNAFITTNRGLVYVDCTGVTEIEASWIAFSERYYGIEIELDTIAYIKAGKGYGVIGIDAPFISPKYSYYEDYIKILDQVKPSGIVESIRIYW